MSTTRSFLLPDLGEGLPDAEIVEWHVKEGDSIQLDEPLVSMETAKAVVDVPSPYSGKVLKLHGGPGDIIETGSPLADFDVDASAPQRADAEDTGHSHGGGGKHAGKGAGAKTPQTDDPETQVIASDTGGEIRESGNSKQEESPEPASGSSARQDAGTVVGAMESSDRVHVEQSSHRDGVKAMPAVRALAKKLKVDIGRVNGSGADGVVTLKDVREAAERGDAGISAAPSRESAPRSERQQPAQPQSQPAAAPPPKAEAPAPRAAGASDALDVEQPIRGVRRNMLRTMAAAHAEVVPTTLMDDADIHAWAPGEDITARLIRSIVVASQAVPALNSWLNAKEGTLRRHSRVDVGIAVDTDDGLFVPALRNCERLNPQQIREGINRIRKLTQARSIPPEELRDYTITLSNFGVFAGKYATPVVVPPCVAIIGAGRLFPAVVPVLGGMEVHRTMPISLTFDHRAATGGEAARFLRAMLDDLQRRS